MNSDWYDTKRQTVKAAQRIVQPPPRFGAQFKRRDTLQKCTQYRLRLESRHGLTDAAVNAGAEGHVSGRAAADVESVGPVPPARIAVGGSKKQQHLLSRSKLHTADLDGFGRGPEKRLHRRFETKDLLKRVANQVRIGTQRLPLLAIAREAIERVAEPVDGGVDARREERTHQHPGLVF